MKISKKQVTRIKNKYTLIILLIVFLILIILSSNSLSTNTYQFTYDELSIPILTYHKFCLGESTDEYTINIDHFKQQMDYLKENDYRVITVAQLLECIENNFFPEKPIVITVDDGFKSVYTLAFPVLKEYGFPATLFLYTDFLANGSNQLSW